MAGRIRSIKPETLDDEVAAGLTDTAWRLWISSWLVADDYGNARAGDRYLASAVWQDSGRIQGISGTLTELCQAGLIDLYEVNGQRYLHINGWEKHQRMDNAGQPRVPGPREGNPIDAPSFAESRGESRRTSATGGESRLDRRPTTDDRRPTTDDRRRAASPRPAGFDFGTLYERYPRKEGKSKGLKICAQQIVTLEEYELLGRAIDAYAVRCRGTETRYVKQFSTFMGCWRDYLEAPTARAADEGEVVARYLPIETEAPRLARNEGVRALAGEEVNGAPLPLLTDPDDPAKAPRAPTSEEIAVVAEWLRRRQAREEQSH